VESVLAEFTVVSIEVDVVKGGLEGVVIVVVRVQWITRDFTSPVEGSVSQSGDDEEDLAPSVRVGTRAEGKGESDLRHEVAIFRDFAVEFRGRHELGFLDTGKGRGVRIGRCRGVLAFAFSVFKILKSCHEAAEICVRNRDRGFSISP